MNEGVYSVCGNGGARDRAEVKARKERKRRGKREGEDGGGCESYEGKEVGKGKWRTDRRGSGERGDGEER